MYVANSEPAKWQRGGGRAGVSERVLISGEPNRSEAGRDMGRQCVLPGEHLLLWWGELLTPLENRTAEGEPQAEREQRWADLRIVLKTQGRGSLVTAWRRKP